MSLSGLKMILLAFRKRMGVGYCHMMLKTEILAKEALMRFLRLGIVALLFTVAALAQSDRGTITGTVSDSTGAVVPSAAITARNVETGATSEAATTATGNYTIASLPAGSYELTVEVAGFKKYSQRGITVQVAQIARVD